MSSVIFLSTTITVEDLVTDEPPLYGPVSFAHLAYVTNMLLPIRASIISAGTSFAIERPKKAHRDGTTGSNRASLARVTLQVNEDVGLNSWVDNCQSVAWRTDADRHLLMQYWIHLVELRFQLNGVREEPFDTL